MEFSGSAHEYAFYISEKADRGKCPYVADELKPQEEKLQGEVIQATEQGK